MQLATVAYLLIQVTFQQETDLCHIDVHVYVYSCGVESKRSMNHSQNGHEYETDTVSTQDVFRHSTECRILDSTQHIITTAMCVNRYD